MKTAHEKRHSRLLRQAVYAALAPQSRSTCKYLPELVAAAIVVGVTPIASAQVFPAEFELSSLLEAQGGDGTNGFVLPGIDPGDISGISVADGGDINGDGIDDFIIGAADASVDGAPSVGESYVVFGSSNGFLAEFPLAELQEDNGGDGSAGFILKGVSAYDVSGIPVNGTGDINGDGIDDIAITAPGGDPGGRTDAGEVYVVFGRTTGFPAEFDLSSLLEANGGDGSAGFVANGINADDFIFFSDGAGDVNDDGIDDLIIGAILADPAGRMDAGQSYVIYGRTTGFPTEFELSDLLESNGGNGSQGFVLNGIDPGDYSGISASGAGDVNGDNISDLIIGANTADPSGESDAGETYIVFGRDAGFPAEFELADLLEVNGGDGSEGFVLNGIDAYDISGYHATIEGDINGDGIDDVILDAFLADLPDGRTDAGEVYVVFGRDSGFPPEIELSSLLEINGGDGTVGFVMNGRDAGDVAGFPRYVGDVNGDRIDDVMITAPLADPGGRPYAGESYVVFGRKNDLPFPPELELADLASGDGSDGFVLNGIRPFDSTGRWATGAGDVNGDDINDLLIGAFGADPGGRFYAGQSYVVFGRATVSSTVSGLETRFAVCRNLTDAQTVVVPFPGIELESRIDCETEGLTVSAGDQVRLRIRGVNFNPTLAGDADRLTNAVAGCRNLTTGDAVPAPLDAAGRWDCAAAGLPLGNQHRISVVIRGEVE